MLRRIFSLLAIAVLVTATGWSQETRGTIVGRVTDASGAVVPGADVQVVNQAMGTTVSLKTNQEGYYAAALLLPGTYQVKVSATGFKTLLRSGVVLQIADRIEVNGTLEVGTAEQSVTVSGATELLGTETASMGNVISASQIMHLPMSYGNPFLLMAISTGTSFQGNARLDRPFEPTHIANYAMDGARGLQNDVTIDGSPATATANDREVIASYAPTPDMLAEFKVQTATFDAAVGNAQGGVTNLGIKSGTNALHGTAYYAFQRKDFWANDFYNNKLGNATPDFKFDRWGGTAGGPVWIPKLYNGKNKTFFFFGYEGIHDARPRNDIGNTPNVPTPDMKNGDFSALLRLGTNYQIYNPYTRRQVGARFVEDPFAGNLIPNQYWNTVGKNILNNYYPAPSSPQSALADFTNNMLEPDLTEPLKYYTATGRIDHNIGDKQRMYGRYSQYMRNSTYDNYLGNLATGTQFGFDSRNAVFDDTIILSPTTVLDLRYGYNRFVRYQDNNAASQGFDLTTLGFPAAYNALIPADLRRFPRIDLSNYISTATTGGEYRPVDTHSFAASLSKTVGAHALRAGMEFRAYRETDGFFGADQTGRYNFDATYTRGPNDNSTTAPSNIGQSVAALLMGIPSVTNTYVNLPANYAEQSNAWGIYAQDDWKVTKKLTLNLGLRWEFETPLTERYNRSVVSFDPNYVPPFAAAAQAAYAATTAAQMILPASQWAVKGGLTFAGVGGNSHGLYNTPKKNLLPRIGFAYQLTSKTVLRGGFGMYQGFLGERRSDVQQAGFSQQTPFSAFAADGTTLVRTLSNPFDSLLQPVGNSLGGQTYVGQNVTYFNQNPLMPTMYRWQMDVQRQLPGGILFEVGYVGNKGVHQEIDKNTNGLPDQYLSTSPFRDNSTTCTAGQGCGNGYVTAQVPNPYYGLTMPRGTPAGFTSTTISRQQLLLPFPQFGSITTTTNQGNSWYHSLQIRADKRLSKGLLVSANYTFSKTMQALEYLNSGDALPTRMISDQDTPHRIALSWIYQFPFGKGRALLSGSPGVVERIVGGWEMTGNWGFSSGLPIPFTAIGSPAFNFARTMTTNNGDYFLIADPSTAVLPLDQRTADRWFNTTPFVTASAAQSANHLRVNPYRFNGLRGPRANNIDLSVNKDTRIREGHVIRFSVQALNAFNHPMYAAPSVAFTNVNFGIPTGSVQQNYPRRLQLELKYIF
ncbi:MAG: TonB-dependent receptor [Acidobacteriia bacterium]|nr:TonB-dependent receptor [Terriglobia bacterium]